MAKSMRRVVAVLILVEHAEPACYGVVIKPLADAIVTLFKSWLNLSHFPKRKGMAISETQHSRTLENG